MNEWQNAWGLGQTVNTVVVCTCWLPISATSDPTAANSFTNANMTLLLPPPHHHGRRRLMLRTFSLWPPRANCADLGMPLSHVECLAPATIAKFVCCHSAATRWNFFYKSSHHVPLSSIFSSRAPQYECNNMSSVHQTWTVHRFVDWLWLVDLGETIPGSYFSSDRHLKTEFGRGHDKRVQSKNWNYVAS